MRRLIHDLLEYSRTSNAQIDMARTDANRVLGLALQNLQFRLLESGAKITFDRLPEVTANEGMLVRVFQNLIGNALKYTVDSESPRVHISAKQAGDEWVFSVEDHGIGIDAQFHERIFIPFERFHDQKTYPGTGVGLAISKRIIERHGGRMWVESQPHQGATFFFTLPVES